MRHKRTSSASSGSVVSSSSESSSRHRKASKSKRARSRSASPHRRHHKEDTRRRSRSKKSSRHRRRSSSSGSASSSSSRSRSKSKSSNKKSKKSRRRSSSSSSSSNRTSMQKKQQSRLLNMDREKNYDFKDSLNDLHKSEQGRRHHMQKVDEGDGFKPKSFKSSRATQKPAPKQAAEPDNDIFGITKLINPIETPTLVAPVEFNVLNSNSNSLMHENVNILTKES